MRATGRFLPRKYVKLLMANGWTWQKTGKCHILWIGPEGQRLVSPTTSSDWRALENMLRDFRHAGIDLKRMERG